MLTGQTMILDTSNNDMFPIGFISTDDGRTLLVVAEHEDGSLQIMAAPVTLMQQNNLISPSYVKTMEGHLVMHPQGALLLVQTLDAVPTTLDDTEVSRDKEIQVEVPDCVTLQNTTHNILLSSNKKQNSILKTNSRSITVKKSINKRSPGRPRKNGTTLISASTGDLKCNICEQEFNKKFLYRKHMDHHAEEKPHRCPKCPASFNIPTNFTLHMATHNIGEPKCPECSKKFTRMASLKSHMLLHEKEENLFCTECEDAFSTKAQLDAHLKLHGEKCSTEDVRKCKLCNKQFVQPALYRLHIREHYRLQTKIVKQTKRGTKHKTMYKCTICLKSFQKPSQLMRHIRVHTGEKPFKCTVCSRAFTQKGSLQIHMWQHDGIRPHACSLCNAKFCQKGNLNAHILRVHSAPVGEPIYGCAYCSCIFRKLGSLNSHIKRMHSNAIEETTPKCDSSTEADMQATVDSVMSQLASLESSVSNPADSTESNSTSTLKKDILLQALKNSGLPNKNKTSKSGTSESKKVEAKTAYVTLLDRAPDGTMRKYLTIKQRSIGNIKWYSCFFCHKEFKKPSDLIRHLRVHTQEKPFKCSYCFRSFALKSTMIAHERTHTGAKKYSCSSCDKTFACHSSLTAHTRLHTKPHKCTVCDKSFSSSAFLKSHMKNHAKEKSKISPEAESLVPQIVLQEPLVISDAGNKISVARVQSKQKQVYDTADVARQHKCWVCHAAFRKISHLKQHYRRHTGERPFKCTKCDRRFTSNSVLKSHLHTHDDSRPYSCTVCNTKFSTQSSMKRHLVTHSNKRPFMCPYCHKTFKTSVNCRKHMKIHKHELAQRQLEQQKTQDDTYDTLSKNKQATLSVPENLTLSDDIEVSFQPQMAPDFTQAFSDQFQNITEEKDKSFLPTDTETHAIINTNLPEIDATNIGTSQTLHADETGTITLPNYTGDQTLTPESIREIEETLNQQLFNIGINLGIGGNLSRQIDDTNADTHESREQQPVLNIIYDNNKSLDSSANTIFTPQFDSFDMSQITLQTDTEIDMGLNATTSTNMSSILPSSVQEIQQLPPVSLTSDINDSQVKIAKQVMILNSKQSSSDFLRLNQTCPKYPKVIAKADTTNSSEIRIQNSNCDNPSKSTIVCNNNGNNKLRFMCDICNENFQDSSQLKTHSKLHTLSDIVCSDINESIDIAQCNSLLQCHICSETGFTTEGLKDHLVIHRGTKGFQCTECLLKFCTNGGLSRHLKMHTNKQQWKCSICQKVFGSKALLKSHSKIHDNWNVTSVEPDSSQREGMPSDIKLSAISTLDVGLSSDSSVSEKVLMDIVAEKKIIDRIDGIAGKKEMKEYTNKCKYCPKTFRKPSDLIRHVRTHTGERPYKCDYCGKSFAVKCTLDSHLKVHSGKKTLCCHVCNSMFATKGSLKVHMRLHTGSKPFRCPICDLRFRTSGHRKVHLLKHMREYKGSPKRKQRHMKVAAVTEAAASLEKIVESTTEQTAPDNVVPENIHYSNLEDTISIDTSGLASQITFNADGTVVSNNSMLSLNESNQLVANLHFLLANGLVTIQADDALLSQGATSNANIIQNQSRVTEFITPTTVQVPCIDADTNHVVIANQVPAETVPQTDQTTVQLNNCMTLMPLEQTTAAFNKIEGNLGKQNKSNPSKKECDICGKTFMKPYQVKRHKRIHTGERPYKCDLCTKSFAQRSTLQMHQKHHTGDRPHPCLHCKYSFTQKGNLQTHLKRVHQLDTLNVEKVRRGQQVLNARVTQDSLSETKTLSLDDISFVEFLK